MCDMYQRFGLEGGKIEAAGWCTPSAVGTRVRLRQLYECHLTVCQEIAMSCTDKGKVVHVLN
jgi:hypothetical protein